MFPAASEQRKVEDEVTKNYEFDIFCTCRMLETRKRMVLCGKCGEWFHHDCENIPKAVFSSSYGFAVLALKLLPQIFLSS